ncbi:NACHT, LRR and PYD domains-containing protein 1 homolog isoform X2 [Sardina pilchardus]|uniref:NACHT, LRR and PYD domains-containing protein 1 homolog isoform X2 n=1 Tax=Sardina pilchardus TaxID=27697 RepID=UPI002E137F58
MDRIFHNARFVEQHKTELIRMVGVKVIPLVDQLMSQGMLQLETLSKIHAANTSQERMRELFKALDTGGDRVKSAFYCTLREHDPQLIQDLEQSGGSSSRTAESSSPEVKRVRYLGPDVAAYKAKIHAEYKLVQEYNSLPGDVVLLDDRYIEPRIARHCSLPMERGVAGTSSRGESLGQFLDTRAEEPHSVICLGQLFSPDHKGTIPKAVVLQGGSGYGKSFTAQKILSDWASGRPYCEYFHMVLFLRAQEVIASSGHKSVLDLFCSSDRFRPMVRDFLLKSPDRMLFIIDGFDDLDVAVEDTGMPPPGDALTPLPGDAFTPAPVEATLKALLKGQVLPQSILLVTTRSAASDRLSKLLKRPLHFTEILGFSEHAVEEYIHRFFDNKQVSETLLRYVRLNPILLSACLVPVVCWIVCTVFQGLDVMRGLETTTSVFVEFLLTLLEHHCQDLSQPVPALLRSLGQLAERGILEQRVLFDEKSISEDLSDPMHVPFLCKNILEVKGSLETMYSFTHPGFMEFFCALHHALIEDEDVVGEKLKDMLLSAHKGRSNRHYVIQFLCGLSNKEVGNSLMEPVFMEAVTFSTSVICGQLRRWILDEMRSPGWGDQSKLFILLCLFELHDRDFAEQAMGVWADITLDHTRMGKTDCWALLYCLQCCQRVQTLSLLNCNMTSEKLRMLQPALSRCKQLGLEVEDLSGHHLGELILDVAGESRLHLSVTNITDRTGESLGMLLRLTKDVNRFTVTVRHHTHLAPERHMPVVGLPSRQGSLPLVEPRALDPTVSHSSSSSHPHTKPAAPHRTPAHPYTESADSHRTPTRPHMEPPVPHRTPTRPHTESADSHRTPTRPHTEPAVSHLTLTLLHSEGIAKVNWAEFFQKFHQLWDLKEDTVGSECCVAELLSFLHSLSDCERLEVGLRRLTEGWANRILTLIEVSPSLKHIRLCAGLSGDGVLEENAIQILRDSPKRPGCTLVIIGCKPEQEGEGDQVNIQMEGRAFNEQRIGRIRLQQPAAETEDLEEGRSDEGFENEDQKKCLHEEEMDTAQDEPGLESSAGKLHQHFIGALRSCQSCAGIPDSTHWALIEPSISTETGLSVYCLSSPAGSYECRVSGLRWVCAAEVTLQYHFCTEEQFSAQLELLQYRPISPLMDIKVLSGELEEVHLPHSLCLGLSDHSKIRDAVRVLHGDDSGVTLEMCELMPFHARLVRPCFSLKEVVAWMGFSVPTHCEVLIYQSYPDPLILNTYVVPVPSRARHAVERDWQSRGIYIKKPRPKESFWINSNFKLSTSCRSEIEPKEITLTYNTPPEYFEVCIKKPDDDFHLKLTIPEEERSIWKAIIRKGPDYKNTTLQNVGEEPGALRLPRPSTSAEIFPVRSPSTSTEQYSPPALTIKATDFVFNARTELINRIEDASLRTLLDGLQKPTPDMPPVIKGRERNEVLQKNSVTEDQVTCLVDKVLKKGERACERFLSLLKGVEPGLCEELGL